VDIRYGGFINNGVSLDLLNQVKESRRLDSGHRSHGATATIDLSQARTVDDVVNDINSNTSIHVPPRRRNSFQLTDNTGQTASNLKVSEVAGALPPPRSDWPTSTSPPTSHGLDRPLAVQ